MLTLHYFSYPLNNPIKGSKLHKCNIIFPIPSALCVEVLMEAGRFIAIYLAIYIITVCAFEGRAWVCFGILPWYEGVAKAIEKGKKSKFLLHNQMMVSKDSMTCDLKLNQYYYFRTPNPAIPCNDIIACLLCFSLTI